MKKLALAAVAASALAAPVVAQEAPANPFVATQGAVIDPLVFVAVVGGGVIIAASSADGSR